MRNKLFMIVCAALALPLLAEVRTGDFSRKSMPPTAETVAQYRNNGLTCPDAGLWPQWWSYFGNGGEISFPSENARGSFARITGSNCFLQGYHALPLSGDFVLELYVRGKGTLAISFASFIKTPDNKVQFISSAQGAKGVTLDLDNTHWERYRFHIFCPSEVYNVHPAFRAISGTIDFDNVIIYRDNAHLMALADAEAFLRQKKVLSMMSDAYAMNDTLKRQIVWFQMLLAHFKDFEDNAHPFSLYASLLKQADELSPYLFTPGIATVKADLYCNMLCLGTAMLHMMTSKYTLPVELSANAMSQIKAAEKQNTVTIQKQATQAVIIADVKPQFVLYEEGQQAKIDFTIKNTTGQTIPGTVTLTLGYDINNRRLVEQFPLDLPAGTYKGSRIIPVGQETFGREIEVKFTARDGSTSASAREYFQVAKEFMRVMMHGTSNYANFFHNFAHEPTDFGVQITADKQYLACQCLYKINRTVYDGLLKQRTNVLHLKNSFYQNRTFGGIMGYEEIRKHPDYILYGANGQPQIDPIYGGNANPFELAAPVERDKERRAQLLNGQSFLDLDMTAWHHVCANFCNPEVLRYGTKCITDYMKAHSIDAIYLDDIPSVQGGYTWDGKHTIVGKSREELAELNKEIARIWHQELRKNFPDIGSWCNGISPGSSRWYRAIGMWERTMGMNVDVEEGKDVNDHFIKELTAYKNTMFLSEVQDCFIENHESPERHPDQWLAKLIEQRDFLIQKYGGSVVFGYMFVPEGKANDETMGCWPTLSYFHALTVATQHHHILLGGNGSDIYSGMPSQNTFDQFMTRYSALIWGRDIKSDYDTAIKVGSGSEDILYKDFIYSRELEKGRDQIVHLVRKYPLERWDFNWAIQPVPFQNLPMTMAIPAGMKVASVKCMRPFLPNETQEVHEFFPEYKIVGNELHVTLPDMHYYLMVAVQLEKL